MKKRKDKRGNVYLRNGKTADFDPDYLPLYLSYQQEEKLTWKTLITILLAFLMFYVVIFLFATSSLSLSGGYDEGEALMSSGSMKTQPIGDGNHLKTLSEAANLEGPCKKFKKYLDLLIVIKTDVSDVIERNLIRATYGGLQKWNDNFHSMTYFLVDLSNGTPDEQIFIKEMENYNDISIFVNEISDSSSGSSFSNPLNFTLFPKTESWLKSCIQNSYFVIYLESLHLLKVPQLLTTLKVSPNYIIPSVLQNSNNNVFISTSSMLSITVGPKTENWATFIPNNIQSIVSEIQNVNNNLQSYFVSNARTSNKTVSVLNFDVTTFYKQWLQSKPPSNQVLEDVFIKLRIKHAHAKKRHTTFQPSSCISEVSDFVGADTKRILLIVNSEYNRFSQREKIRNTFGSEKIFERNGKKLEIFIRFLTSQHKYILFKDENTKLLEAETNSFHDVLGYYKMALHDFHSYNVTSSLRLAIDWANQNCSMADYVMLLSDETFVNPYLLHDYLFENTNVNDSNDLVIDGMIRHTSLPSRKYNKEGFVSKVLYPDMIFPPYIEFSNGALLTKQAIKTISSLPYTIRDSGLNEVTLGIYARCSNIVLLPNLYHTPSKLLTHPYPLHSITIPNASANFTSFWSNISSNPLSSQLKIIKHKSEATTELLKGFNATDPETGLVNDVVRKYPVQLTPQDFACKEDKHNNEDNTKQLLFVIISAPSHFELRATIRSTWGKIQTSRGIHISKIFVLGVPSVDLGDNVYQDIVTESAIYDDIVMFEILDNYRNATLKTVNGLNWALENCVGVDFVQKIDDDAFANIYGLSYYMSHFAPRLKLYMGQISKQGKVLRKYEKGMPENFKKWIINKFEYPGDTYPPYALGGPGYLMSRDVVEEFLNEAWKTQTFVFEDAYIGILNTKAKINPVSHYLFNNNPVDNSKCDCHKYYTSHYTTPDVIWKNWFHLHGSEIVKCVIKKC